MSASAAYALIACFSLTGEALTCKPLDTTATMAECAHALSKAAEKVATRGDNQDPIVMAITRYVFECVSADNILPSRPIPSPQIGPSQPSRTPKPVTPKPKTKTKKPTPGPAMPKPEG